MQDDGGDEVEVCALCCQKHTIMLRAETFIVLSVFTITLVGTKLCITHNTVVSGWFWSAWGVSLGRVKPGYSGDTLYENRVPGAHQANTPPV